MQSLSGKREIPNQLDQNDTFNLGEKIAKDLVSKIDNSTFESMKMHPPTSGQTENMQKRLEEMAIEAENLFGKTPDISNTKVQEFIKSRFTDFILSIEETVKNNPPDLIREASVSEAVFSHKNGDHPVLATDSLATCIGVGGYDPINQFGFVIHFSGEDEVEANGSMLLDRIREYRVQNENAPLLLHLRGGVKGWSEPLLASVKEWLLSSTDLKSIIASEDTLHEPVYPGVGLPKVPGTIKLDVRTGSCETYDCFTNPYAKNEHREVKSDTFYDIFMQVATKKPEIKIVYDSNFGPLKCKGRDLCK